MANPRVIAGNAEEELAWIYAHTNLFNVLFGGFAYRDASRGGRGGLLKKNSFRGVDSALPGRNFVIPAFSLFFQLYIWAA